MHTVMWKQDAYSYVKWWMRWFEVAGSAGGIAPLEMVGKEVVWVR
jgi:hypothetical protein